MNYQPILNQWIDSDPSKIRIKTQIALYKSESILNHTIKQKAKLYYAASMNSLESWEFVEHSEIVLFILYTMHYSNWSDKSFSYFSFLRLLLEQGWSFFLGENKDGVFLLWEMLSSVLICLLHWSEGYFGKIIVTLCY